MPLINAHTHLEFSTLSHLLPNPDARFAPWLATAGRSVRGRNEEWFRRACDIGIERLLEAGTTHVGDISWSGASIEPLARSGLYGIVWLEMRGMVLSQGRERFEWLRQRIDGLRAAIGNARIQLGVEIHAPYSLHPSLWEPVLRWIEDQRLPLCMHAAESVSEWDLFTRGKGDLTWFEATMALSGVPGWFRYPAAPVVAWAAQLGLRWKRTLSSPPGTTPIAYLERMGVLDLRPTLVHMVQVCDEDIARIRRSGSTVVHCPRSNMRLRCGRMPLEKYLAAGVPVLLGTDSLASSPTLDVRDEVVAARHLHGDLVQEDRMQALAHAAGVFERLATSPYPNAKS